MRETNRETSHINTSSKVLSKLSSQGINIEEEVKALTLLSSLPASWEVFCTTFSNNCLKLNLDEMIGQVLTEDIRRKSMGLTIDESAEAHKFIGSTVWENKMREPVETRVDRDIGKTDNTRNQGIVDQLFSAHIGKPVPLDGIGQAWRRKPD